MNTRIATLLTVLLALVLVAGCDDGGDSSVAASTTSGTVTLGADEGIDFNSGEVQRPGNFGNSDIYATRNGSALKLSGGGPNIVDVRPLTFFQGAGGVFPTYEDIDAVPNVKPVDGQDAVLPKARTGNGFTILNAAGFYSKGFIVSADETSVTIQYQPLP